MYETDDLIKLVEDMCDTYAGKANNDLTISDKNLVYNSACDIIIQSINEKLLILVDDEEKNS